MRLHTTLYHCNIYQQHQTTGHNMQKLTYPTLGKIALVVGVALIMFAAAGISSTFLPQFTIYYYSAGAGITAIVAGLILAVRIEDARQSGNKKC